MMRIFVYEFVCGGGLAGRSLPESLAREGWAMLASIVDDLAAVEGIEVTATRDARFASRPLCAAHIVPVAGAEQPELVCQLAARADWTLVIAPESQGTLEQRVRWVEQSGGRLLGPSAPAVALAADKLSCTRHLAASGVPAVVGRLVRPADGLPADALYPAVLKPRDGAGSQCTFLVTNSQAAERVAQQAMAEGLDGDALLEPYMAGTAASVALLVGPERVLPLAPARQILSTDGRFQYLGGRVPIEPALARRATALGARAAAAIPGLRGYVGIDLVLGDSIAPADDRTPEPRGDVVIEVNPRLTTSYVGLRALAETNLADTMLRVCRGEPVGEIRWRAGAICFEPDGTVRREQ